MEIFSFCLNLPTNLSETVTPPYNLLLSLKANYQKHKQIIIWQNVYKFIALHVAALSGLYLLITSPEWKLLAFTLVTYIISCFGVTAGAHRLWSHRSYKAKWQFRVLVMLMNTLANQKPAMDWARDHRGHHKFSDTDADPHNASRGLFFSHIGWTLVKKHPEVIRLGKTVDLSDLTSDPVLVFQKRHFWILAPLFCYVWPTLVPVYLWNVSYLKAFLIAGVLRYILSLHSIWMINSYAHAYGDKPYDDSIRPTENTFLSVLIAGEGYHNYHHVFPWDYKAQESSVRGLGNITTIFLDAFATIGWVYDRKTVSADMVKRRVRKTGDGSHETWGGRDECDEHQEQSEDYATVF